METLSRTPQQQSLSSLAFPRLIRQAWRFYRNRKQRWRDLTEWLSSTLCEKELRATNFLKPITVILNELSRISRRRISTLEQKTPSPLQRIHLSYSIRVWCRAEEIQWLSLLGQDRWMSTLVMIVGPQVRFSKKRTGLRRMLSSATSYSPNLTEAEWIRGWNRIYPKQALNFLRRVWGQKIWWIYLAPHPSLFSHALITKALVTLVKRASRILFVTTPKVNCLQLREAEEALSMYQWPKFRIQILP